MVGYRGAPDLLPGMMSTEDVTEMVAFALERPRHLRILEEGVSGR
jgi:hypothetical protein